jgi:transcriptional regulator with XRE-family HTH domain
MTPLPGFPFSFPLAGYHGLIFLQQISLDKVPNTKRIKTIIKYLKPLGHGAQTRLSRKTGVSTNIICSIIKGRRTASERTKNRIANGLGYTYDEFLTFGRGDNPKNNRVTPIRRRRDLDPKFAQAAALLEEIYDIGKESLILDQIIGMMEQFLVLLKENLKRKPPGRA